MEPVDVNFIVSKDLEEELLKVKQAIQGIGEEGYLSFRHLRKESERATKYINENSQKQIGNLLQIIHALKVNEAAQDTLLVKLKEGSVLSREYAEEQTKLSNNQAELKIQIADLNEQLEREIQLSLQSLSILEKRTTVFAELVKMYMELNHEKKLLGLKKEDALKNISPNVEAYVSEKKDPSTLPAFDTLYNLKKLSKSDPRALAVKVGYESISGAVEESGKLSKVVDEGMAYMTFNWDRVKKKIAVLGSALQNFFSGNWKAANLDIQQFSNYDLTHELNSIRAGKAVSIQYDLNEVGALHVELIKVNNQQIQAYCKTLQDSIVPLEERKKIFSEAIRLEDENHEYRSTDLVAEYLNVFLLEKRSEYENVQMRFKDELLLLEKYFKDLNEGKALDFKDQKVYTNSLHRIISSPDIIWSKDTKSQFESFFTRAVNDNKAHLKNINLINDSYSQGQSGRERADMKGCSTSSVLSSVSFPGFQTNGTLLQLFDSEAFRKELEEKKKLYQEDINGYIAYLQGKIAAAKQNPLPEGKEEEKILNRELASAERTKENRLESLLSQYQGYTTKMTSLATSYQAEMALLNQAMKDASTEAERQRIEEAIDMRTDGYTASLVNMEAENEGFSKVLFGDLRNISKEALNQAIAEARDFIAQWSANAGELSPETEKVVRKIQEGIEKAETSLNETGGKKDDFAMADHFRDAAAALQGCADLAYVFDESLGDVIQTAADVAQGAADIAAGVASFSANPLQGATSILGGVTKIVGSLGKRMQENEKIRQEYLQGLVETYSKELEYNSVLRERLRIQQQLGETSLDYFNRLQTELGKQQGDINREYTEVWNKLMKEQYISGTGYKHGTWLRKAKTWNEYDSLAGKSYEEIESLYTQDKLEGSAKTLFERLRELKEEGADVVEMMDQLNEEMKESWTGTTTSAITDSIVQGFLDGKRSAADFADTFEDMMKTAMMQSVKMKYLEGPLEEWYAKFAEASEGGLTEEKIADLRRQYEQIVANAAREAENMEAITGLGASAEAARQATAQGIASMSQETASELNGNFYALQYLTANIDRNVTNIQSVLYQASDQWIRIEENTRYCRKLETMEKDMSAIRKDMQDINNKGILMRTR